jgi:hypothetical protein
MYRQSFMVREPRVYTWGSLIGAPSKEDPMTTLQDAKQSQVAAAKAERESDKAAAMREYQAEKLASQANMARLRALRLANANADSQPQAAQRPAKRKVATKRR